MIQELLEFLKNPVYKQDKSVSLNEKIRLLLFLLGLALLISFALALIIGIVESAFNLNLGEHAMNRLFDDYSPEFIFAMAVIFAPVLEELLFRGPMYLFRNSRYFNILFYLFTLAFGFYHLTNFEIDSTILYLSPLLVAPQLIIGLMLGYIRVRLGLEWAILLHACYNLILIGPLLLLKSLDIPLS